MEKEIETWGFEVKKNENRKAPAFQIRDILRTLIETANKEKLEGRDVIPLGHGDPSVFACFRTTPAAEDAVVDALTSASFNFYAPLVGLLPARRAVANYLSRDLPYKLSYDDVHLTLGCGQAIEITMAGLAQPGANILLPRPGFPAYEAFSARYGLQVRHFDLMPENNWEVDLEVVKSLADQNTAAMVIINPNNPCGNVFTYQHLEKIAETARKLRIMVIADEVYGHLEFGTNPFVPMGIFASVVPVLTLGSISKRWIVPGWRFGWLVTNDPTGILRKTGVMESILVRGNHFAFPPTFMQAAVPQILENTADSFFMKIKSILRECADICYDEIQDIPCFTCPKKPEGSMFVMVKLNLSMLEDIEDEIDFCLKLAKEESTIILPGTTVGLKNWLRITFAIDPSALKDGLGRTRTFCKRYAKN